MMLEHISGIYWLNVSKFFSYRRLILMFLQLTQMQVMTWNSPKLYAFPIFLFDE